MSSSPLMPNYLNDAFDVPKQTQPAVIGQNAFDSMPEMRPPGSKVDDGGKEFAGNQVAADFFTEEPD